MKSRVSRATIAGAAVLLLLAAALPAHAEWNKGLEAYKTKDWANAVKEFEEGKFLMMVTAGGKLKKTRLSAFANIRKSGIIAISLAKDDSLIAAKLTSGNDEVFMATKEGNTVVALIKLIATLNSPELNMKPFAFRE